MASQVTSGYSTEGTQYATDNSYYLLDSLAGPGDIILGPVTVSGNLTVTGTTTAVGALGASSVNTNTITSAGPAATHSSAGSLALSAVTTASLAGATTNVNASAAGGVNVAAAAGPVNLTASTNLVASGATGVAASSTLGPITLTTSDAVAGNITLTAANGATVQGVGRARLQHTGAVGSADVISNLGNVVVNAAVGAVQISCSGAAGQLYMLNSAGNGPIVQSTTLAVANGYDTQLKGETFMSKGFAVGVGQGTFAAPAQIPQPVPGANIFQMTTQKAFLTTGANAGGVGVNILFPLADATQNWIPVLGQIGVTATNVSNVYTNGTTAILVPTNPLAPCTFSIVLL